MAITHQYPTDKQPSPWWQEALAGCIATFPMTIFMLATQRLLPGEQQYELPPELITKELARRAHIISHLGKKQILAGTLVSHFAYGAAVGACYRPLSRQDRIPAPASGSAFGLLVWLMSYFGLLPLFGMTASAQREPARRNLLMATAHIVWGSTLGIIVALLSAREQN